jgi:hypothetical protein
MKHNPNGRARNTEGHRFHSAMGLARRCLVAILTMSLLSIGPVGPWQALAQVRVPDRDAAADLVAAFVSLTAELRAAIDRTQFDLDSLSMEMFAMDAADIADWVRGSIAFEPYVGLLRGAEGTLMARAGNALDQSVLLATLLRNVGYDAEIAHAELSIEDAQALVLEALHPPLRAPAVGDLDAMEQVLERVASLLGADGPEVALEGTDGVGGSPVQEMVVAEAAWIGEQLEREGIVLSATESGRVLVDESRSYYWVRYRLSPAEPWREAHPSFGRSAPPDDVLPTSVLTDSVPEELQHRVRFQAMIERRVGEQLEVVPVTSAWERPTALLAGEVLTFTNVADSFMSPADLLDLDEAFAAAQVFVPIFNDVLAPGAVAFDLDGVTLDPSDALNPAAGVFREVGRRFQAGQSALGGIGQPDDAESAVGRALTAYWLEFTVVSPGGSERTYRRSLFDAIGDSARDDGAVSMDVGELPSVAAALTSSVSFMVTGGALPDALVLDQKLKRIIEAEQLSRALILDDPATMAAAVPNSGWLGHLDLAMAFEMGAVAGQAPSFRNEPGLVVSKQSLASEGVGTHVLDIIANPRRVLVMGADGRVVSDPGRVIQAGVWDTYVEAVMLGENGLAPRSAAAIMASVRETGRAAEVLYGSDAIVPPWLPEPSRRAMTRDLLEGYVVLMAPPSPDDEAGYAWWRVDPRTGATLGLMDDGIGGVFKEYALLFGPIALGVAAGAVQFFGCLGSPDEPEDLGESAALAAKLAFCGLCGLFVAATATVAVWVSGGVAFGIGALPTSAIVAEILLLMACNAAGLV